MSSNPKKVDHSLGLPYRFAKEKGVIFDRIENEIVYIKSNNSSVRSPNPSNQIQHFRR